jgi:hypothetical protein
MPQPIVAAGFGCLGYGVLVHPEPTALRAGVQRHSMNIPLLQGSAALRALQRRANSGFLPAWISSSFLCCTSLSLASSQCGDRGSLFESGW